MSFDFRKIDSQAALGYLFKQTNFGNDDCFSDGGIVIEAPEEDYQSVHIGECRYMGSITVADDFENSGYDALFVQTLVQLFKKGKLKYTNDTD